MRRKSKLQVLLLSLGLLGVSAASLGLGKDAHSGSDLWNVFGVELNQDADEAVQIYSDKYGVPVKTTVNLESIVEGCVAVASKRNRSKCVEAATAAYGEIPHHYYFDKYKDDPLRRISINLDTTGPGENRVGRIRFYQNFPPDTPRDDIVSALVKKFGPFDRQVMGSMVWDGRPDGTLFRSASVSKKPDHMLLGMTVSDQSILDSGWKEHEELGAVLGKEILGQ